jgi:HK97 family phage major capsid protein
MTLQELREKRSKLLSDAHAIMSGADVTAEQRTAVDKMLADANILQADAQRMEQLEAHDAEQRSSGRIPRGAPAADASTETRSIAERRSATGIALRSFLHGEQFERRDLTVAIDGGVMIPVGVTDPKIALKDAGSVYDLVHKFRTSTGEAVKAPLLNDLGHGFVLNSAPITNTDPSAGGVTCQVDDIRSNPILLDNSLLQDVEFDLVGFVEKAINSRYLRTVSNWITAGNGSNVAALNTAFTGIIGSTASTVKYADLTGLLAALDPAYSIGSAFLMSNTTLANNILNILDANGRPIFLPFNDGGISGFAGTIFGYPVKLNPYQPGVVTGNVAIQFGNFAEGYTFREVLPGIMLKKSADRWIEINRTGFVAFARVGGVVTNAGTVTAGTTQPIVGLTIK